MKGPSPHPELAGVLTCTGCEHMFTCDGHYNYCSALPDTAPKLRPGRGTHFHWGRNPITPKGEVMCPYLKEEQPSVVENSSQ